MRAGLRDVSIDDIPNVPMNKLREFYTILVNPPSDALLSSALMIKRCSVLGLFYADHSRMSV